MLVNCPKCGFSQPKDKYCAKCGVDMDEFHPATPPLWKTLAGSPVLHVLLVFLAVTSSVLFIRQHHRAELRERAEFIQGGPILVEKRNLEASSPGELAEGEVSLETSSSTAEGAKWSETPPSPSGESPPQAPESKLSASSETTTAPNTDLTKKPKLRVSYYELPRNLIDDLALEMQTGGQYLRFDESQWGVVPDFRKKIQTWQGALNLEQTEKVIELNGTEIQWFNGQDSGLEYFLQATEEAGLIRAELEIQRVFKEGESKTPIRKSFPVTFEISAQQAFVATGLLPRNAVFDGPKPSAGFLKIFNSAQFLSRQTEFTLVLEFDTPSPH